MSEPTEPSPENSTDLGAPPSAPEATAVLETIMFTDIEGSVSLQQRLGAKRYAEVLTRHGALFYAALSVVQTGHVEKHTGDGFMARFTHPSDAVGAALRFQWLLAHEEWGMDRPLRVRIGIHQGEVLLLASALEMPRTVGTAVNLAARVMSLAEGGQVLVTRAVFDEARQSVQFIPNVPPESQAPLGWEAHGAYLVRGIDGAVEIFEVGERDRAPFRRPQSGALAERSVSAEEEATLGWRPAQGLEVPKRGGWFLQKRLGEGGFGEVWLAQNGGTGDLRVFKFCFDAVRLRTFKRELMLFRLIREQLGPRQDIATLYEVQLETPPFFLESEYCAGGTLQGWLEEKLRNGNVPMEVRLSIVARIARALDAAHSVGVIHKDVKPSNIFIDEGDGGVVSPRLADFGIGVLLDPTAVDRLKLSFTGGVTKMDESSRTGTRLYSPPEYLVGKPPSIRGDIFSLGVVLYQLVIGNFDQPIGAGWRRGLADPLLAEDINSCVDVDPDRRFSSALQLAERLEHLEQRRKEQQEAEAAIAHEREQERLLAANRRKVKLAWWGTAIAGVLTAALCIVAVVLYQSSKAAHEHAIALGNARDLAEQARYVAEMQRSSSDLTERRGEAARESIDHYRRKPGEIDRRGWEWFHADSVLNPGDLVRTVSPQPLRALAASPDGAQIAVGGDAGELSIWARGALERTSGTSTRAAIRSLAWNSAGLLAAGLVNGDVVLWETPALREVHRWKAHEGAVTGAAWHPSEDCLVTGGADGKLACWDATGGSLWVLAKSGPVQTLAWSQDGNELAVVLGIPARLLVGKAANLATQHEYEMFAQESALAWRPHKHQVAISREGRPFCSWDPYSTAERSPVESKFSPGASAYAWSPSGDGVAVGGIDGKILLINPDHSAARPLELRVALYGHKGRVTGLHWFADETERLVSIGEDGTLRAWDELRNSPEIFSLALPAEVIAAEWHPSEDRFAVLLAGDEVRVLGGDPWQVQWSRPLPRPTGTRTTCAAGRLAWSPDGRWLAAACGGRRPMVWHLADDAHFIPAGMENVSDVQWTADSRRLLLRTPDGWSCFPVDGGAGTKIPGTAQAAWVGGLGGDLLGVLLRENDALHYRVIDLASGTTKSAVGLRGELGQVRRGALSKDRSRLAVGGETGAILWIDTRTGQAVSPSLAHTGPLNSLGWSPDGARLATSGSDGICRIFNIAQKGQNWGIDHQLRSEVVATGWNADGSRLLLASMPDRLVKIYDATRSLAREKGGDGRPKKSPPAERLARACAAVEEQPGEEAVWQGLAQVVRENRGEGVDLEAELLIAAATLGQHGRFSPSDQTAVAGQMPAKTWRGVVLPRSVQVAQACALKRWEEVVALCPKEGGREAAAAWFALARAEAFAGLGRGTEAEQANFEAWQALRRQQMSDDFVPALPADAPIDGRVDLRRWANVTRGEDSAGGENNNLAEIGDEVQPPGHDFRFHCGDFIQLAGARFRLSGSRMLPRSAGWMPLRAAGKAGAFLVAACGVEPADDFHDHCIGSLFLLRAGGDRAVRIPLIYGRNVWHWWTPEIGNPAGAQDEDIAWRGRNPRATYYRSRLALYQTPWETGAGEPPIVAVAIVSTLRGPAPMLVAAEVLR